MNKNIFIKKLNKERSGIILIIVSWVLVILVLLAISLGRNTNIDLVATKYSISKARSKYLAWAGLIFAVKQLKLDAQNSDSAGQDTLYYCGIPKTEGFEPENIFKEHKLGDGYFNISYRASRDLMADNKRIYYGLVDEERFININTVSSQNASVLSSLFMVLNIDEETSNNLAAAIVDWQDNDDNVTNNNGAEKDYYLSLNESYNCKNAPFNSLPELLLVKGMTKEIYGLVKEYLSVYPAIGGLKVNLDTASYNVLLALAVEAVNRTMNADIADAKSLADKLIVYRNGEDGEEFTVDDRLIEVEQIPLTAVERNIFLQINRYRTKQSNYFRIQVQGVDPGRQIKTNLTAVINREDYSIVYWNIN